MKTVIFSIICFLSLISCNQNKKAQQDAEETVTESKSTTFVIQPFDDIDKVTIDSLYLRLKTIDANVIREKPIKLPESAFYKARNRYRADSLCNFLRQRSTEKTVIVGVTTRDISTTKGEISDWGIMGLAHCPGHACVVSTFRLKKNNLNEQLYKVAIHELGHTEGLDHCKESATCFLKDANGKNHLDALTDFCPFCKTKLQYKGWNIK